MLRLVSDIQMDHGAFFLGCLMLDDEVTLILQNTENDVTYDIVTSQKTQIFIWYIYRYTHTHIYIYIYICNCQIFISNGSKPAVGSFCTENSSPLKCYAVSPGKVL
jgi:hypothetical protein